MRARYPCIEISVYEAYSTKLVRQCCHIEVFCLFVCLFVCLFLVFFAYPPSSAFEPLTVERRHQYFHTSPTSPHHFPTTDDPTPPHHFRSRTNRGLLSKPNQEPPFCDMQSIDQLPISYFHYNK